MTGYSSFTSNIDSKLQEPFSILWCSSYSCSDFNAQRRLQALVKEWMSESGLTISNQLSLAILQPLLVADTLSRVQYLPREDMEVEQSEVLRHTEYQLPPQRTNIFGVMKALKNYPTEGALSLWKGFIPAWTHDVVYSFLFGGIRKLLGAYYRLSPDCSSHVPIDSPGSYVMALAASGLAIGVLLSPLEMAQTRLTVQTAHKKYQKYRGLFHCLRTIVIEEGISAFYWSYNLLPTVLDHTTRMLDVETLRWIIRRIFPEWTDWTSLSSAVFASFVIFLFTIPVRTIRERLQSQVHPSISGVGFPAAVRICPVPYTGFIDCGYKILTTESVSSQKPRRERRGTQTLSVWTLNWGGLYRNTDLLSYIPIVGFGVGIVGFGICVASVSIGLLSKSAIP